MFDDIIRVIIIILFVSFRFGSFNARVYAVRRYAFERFVDVCLFSAPVRVYTIRRCATGCDDGWQMEWNYKFVIKDARRWTNQRADRRRRGIKNARSVCKG